MITRNKLLVITIGAVIIVICGVILFWPSDTKNNPANTNSSTLIWKTFNAAEYGIQMEYPSSWIPYYSVGPLLTALEFTSQERTSRIDEISGQQLNEPLIKVSIYKNTKYPNNLSLDEWINANTEDEIIRSNTLVEKNNWSGRRLWIVNDKNAYKTSSITYYILEGDNSWEARAFIENDKPDSIEFQNAVNLIDQTLQSIKFY
ncbi:MAG: hypothetical protein PHI73_03675 [Patescibacteria group bacterium]|nr:hypothetical protein [Patescibacteria group bacterium]